MSSLPGRRGIRRASAGLVVAGLLLGGDIRPSASASAPGWVRDVPVGLGMIDTIGVDAVVLFARIEHDVDDRLRVSRRERQVIRILRRSGLEWTGFHFTMEPGARLRTARAWTVKRDRVLESEAHDVVETTMDPAAHSDVRRVSIRPPGAAVGDLVAVEFACEEQRPFASLTWLPQAAPMPVLRAELLVQLPAGWSLEPRAWGFDLRPATRTGDRWEFVAGPFRGIPEEASPPSWREVYPYADLRIGRGPAGFQFRTWSDVARWTHDLITPHADPTKAPAELVSRTASQERVEALHLLAREVQHRVGYTAIELGWQRWEPDDAALTWSRRYGDCKDKATLLVSALAARGLEARPVLCLTRSAGRVDPEWPDALQFNHCIVAIAGSARELGLSVPDSAQVEVRSPSGRLWCLFDPTDPTTPLGQVPSNLSESYALIADPAEGLVRVPRATDGRFSTEVHARLDEQGNLTGTIRVQAGGAAAGWLAHRMTTVDSLARQAWLETHWATSHPRPVLSDIRWIGTDSTRWTSTVEANLRLGGAARRVGKRWIFTPPFQFAKGEPPAADSTRTQAYWADWSPEIEDRMVVELPPGIVGEPRAPIAHASDLGRYEHRLQATPERLEISRLYSLRTPLVPAARWPDLRALLQTAYDGDRVPIILR